MPCLRALTTSCGLERGVRLVWAVTTKQFLLGLRTQRSTSASEPGPVLLCMGLFSRFLVPALRCTAGDALYRVRDTRSLMLALTATRFNSRPSCSSWTRHEEAPAPIPISQVPVAAAIQAR